MNYKPLIRCGSCYATGDCYGECPNWTSHTAKLQLAIEMLQNRVTELEGITNKFADAVPPVHSMWPLVTEACKNIELREKLKEAEKTIAILRAQNPHPQVFVPDQDRLHTTMEGG
jgi:hypothetical protein